MTPIQKVIKEKNLDLKPIWLMRQAGRYLPEFRKIRAENTDFMKLCFNKILSQEITLQPLRRFNFDAAIIFSDILVIPFGLGQDVKFEKDYGPRLGSFDLNNVLEVQEIDFTNNLKPIYDCLKSLRKNKLLNNKDLIGFSGAPWTILFYMLNKKSPKQDSSFKKFLKKENDIFRLLEILEKFIKIHIKNQVESGATVIQLFDSWAGLLSEAQLKDLVFGPTKRIVQYVKSLNVPIICFPRGIPNYENFVNEVIPDAISIDDMTNPEIAAEQINVVVQGGLKPELLLGSKEDLKKEVMKYLGIFKEKPYIFNLGHGVPPNTDPGMIEYLVKVVKNFQ